MWIGLYRPKLCERTKNADFVSVGDTNIEYFV